MEAGLSGTRLDLRRTRIERDRPEQSAFAESRIEVVDLIRKVGGRRPLVDVESDESEGRVLMPAGKIDVLAHHHSRVDVESQILE